jgi:hypothetical protein
VFNGNKKHSLESVFLQKRQLATISSTCIERNTISPECSQELLASLITQYLDSSIFIRAMQKATHEKVLL